MINAQKIIHQFHAFGQKRVNITIITFCFILLANVIAYSNDDCNTSLTKEDSYESLSFILTCMNDKIDSLEKKIGQKYIGSANESHYKNEFIQASLNTINLSKDNRSVILSLNLYNHTEENVELMFYSDSSYPSLVGDDGTFLLRPTITGLPVGHRSQSKVEYQYSSLKAKTNTIINIQYKSTKEIEARNFNFSAEMSRFIDGQPDIFSLGIENIKLQ